MKQSCSTGEEDKLVHRSFETCFVIQKTHKHKTLSMAVYIIRNFFKKYLRIRESELRRSCVQLLSQPEQPRASSVFLLVAVLYDTGQRHFKGVYSMDLTGLTAGFCPQP